ncbi:MAG TPA: hypothetical protein VMG36_08555 [Thermoplasmata archaeon]|nr:hypothetical protein [Thermoplasmata archaeon]
MRAREVSGRTSAQVILAMAFLAVTCGELLSGGIRATPFSLLGVFLVPPYVVVALTYGIGVLLVREASVRWDRGWGGTLLLAAANAWVLQGIFTKVLFGPASSPDIQQLGSYGHWLGVNWVLVALALYLDGFLATVVPIFLTNELFPGARGRRLLSDLGVGIALAVFGPLLAWEDIYINANNNVGPSLAHPFVSALSPLQLTVWAIVVVGLCAAAWKVPPTLLRPRTERPVGSPWVMVALGVVATVGTLLVEGLGWRVVPWPELLLGADVLGYAALLQVVRGRVGRSGNLTHRAALVAGSLAPWLVYDVFLEVGGDYLVLPIAGAVFAALAVLWRKGRRAAPVAIAGA